LPLDSHKIVEVDGRSIGLFNVKGNLRAVLNVCPHEMAPVCRGAVRGTTLDSKPGEYRWGRHGEILACPWHQWEFDLLTGAQACLKVEQSMFDLLPDRLPWYVAGPLIGLIVVGLYAFLNKPLGATSSYANFLVSVRSPRHAEAWRTFSFVGLLAGGRPSLNVAYGALGRALPLPLVVPVLLVGGILMGLGARWAGGCTSGHGLCGTSSRSPGSFAATITFMLTAIGVTALAHVITGGIL
jgi:nitrite reductase/ring-hydroxylating ferredoxin subunit